MLDDRSRRLLKTLMAKAGSNVVCVLAPSDKEVSLKKRAAAAGAKDADAAAAALILDQFLRSLHDAAAA